MTREEEIKRVYSTGTHVVLLGAGASFALTLRNAEKYGKKLPLMRNIVNIVGLTDLVATLPQEIKQYKEDFEQLYTTLYDFKDLSEERIEIESKVYDYFKELELPDAPTIYDYLVLSLRRHKDYIATFNWDPFLYQAYVRNGEFIESPGILHLHGCVSLGYNDDLGVGPAGYSYQDTDKYFEPTKLLYPVGKKDYNSDIFIKGQWDNLADKLKVAERVTIFGYSAPVSDVEAIELLQKAWGTPYERNMEQFELIDIRSEYDVRQAWDSFIHSHHYDYHNSFFGSSLARHPRRSVEIYRAWSSPMTPSDMFSEGNPVPEDIQHLDELWEWYQPLINAERSH